MPEPDLRDLDLVAVTSHELRAPLAAIRGFVDILQRRRGELTEPEIQEFLGVIAAQTDRMIRLADDLVTMTSLDAGNIALETEPFLLVPAIETLVRDLPGGERIEIRLADTAPPRIDTDAMRLGQALLNLLQNALKYSSDEHPVVLSIEAAGANGVRFSVIDDGVGIEPDEMERIFELFYRTVEGAQDGRWVGARAGGHAQDGDRAGRRGDRGVHAGRGVDLHHHVAVGGSLSTRSTVCNSVIGLNGFVKYSSAPRPMARSRPSSPSAVTMMTRTPDVAGSALMLLSTSAPLEPGMFMSRKTRSGRSRRTRARAPGPSEASSMSKPSPSSTSRIASRIVGWSSTMRILAPSTWWVAS